MAEENSHMAADRLPPLNAVRAFAAAARHASFTRAADELGVTHGAVSKQVRLLEDHLGVPLFTRGVRQVALTTAGRSLLAEASPALERIAAVAVRLRRNAVRGGGDGVVRVNVRPSFALRWLIPHLPAFMAVHPGVRPELVTSTADPARLPAGSFDVVVRRGRPGMAWPEGMRALPFLRERAAPVAAPALLTRLPVHRAEDLAAHTLLHTATRDADWVTWLARVGVPGLRPAAELRFEHLQFALQAALDGMGVALGPLAMVAADLAAGRLARVLPRRPGIVLESYYYGIPADAGPLALVFADWLKTVST
jgi:LysR family transcriptional regulator, glycine cleavage system transcriptional activator